MIEGTHSERSLGLNHKKILVVDDEADLAELIKLEFELLGAVVSEAHSSEEAIDLIHNQSFDVVISDIRMPGGEGMDIVRELRTMKRDCPVILMSGYSNISDEDSFRLGAVAKLHKPFNRKHLIDIVYKACTPIAERWRTQPLVPTVKSYDFSFQSVADATAKKDILLGKGGACFACDRNLPTVGDMVKIDLHFADKDTELEIIGEIRWSRAPTEEKGGAFGIEFLYISDSGRQFLIDEINQTDASVFIPVVR